MVPRLRDEGVGEPPRRFRGARVLAVLGGPGELSREPWFGRDAIRTAASWAGVADSAAARRSTSSRSAPKRTPLGPSPWGGSTRRADHRPRCSSAARRADAPSESQLEESILLRAIADAAGRPSTRRRGRADRGRSSRRRRSTAAAATSACSCFSTVWTRWWPGGRRLLRRPTGHAGRLAGSTSTRCYARDPDPWAFESSPYEHAKYEHTLAALGEARYRAA